MAASKRERILELLKVRCQAIKTADGYNTDAGLHVSHGTREITPDDPLPDLAIVPGNTPDTVGDADRYLVELPVTIGGLTAADLVNPLAPAERLLADLKRAVLLPGDRTLGGEARKLVYVGENTIDRQAGGTTVGCALRIAVQYPETYGLPS
jgi:hypothetical protein